MEIYLPKKYQPKRKRNIAYLGSKYSNFKYIYYAFEKAKLDKGAKVLDAFGGGANFSTCLYSNRPDLDITYNELDKDVFIYATADFTQEEKEDFVNKNTGLLGNINIGFRFTKEGRFTKAYWHKLRDKFSHTNVEKYFLIRTSFSNGGNTIKKLRWGGVKCNFHDWNNNIHKLNNDALKLDFNDYDMIYLDPPYFNSMTNKGYDRNTNNFINELIEKLNNTTTKWMLSYYPDENVDLELNYKHKYEFKHVKTVGGNVKTTTEVIWTNF